MAAVDLPINDAYLSHLHQVRNARKAAIARISSSLSSTDDMASIAATVASPSSQDVQVSDTAVLSQYPSSLVRLLVLLSPAISVSTRFIQLATWTAGPGTASHSFLLLLAWWAVCLYGYELVRYAPQAVLLSVIAYNGLGRAFRGVTGSRNTSRKSRTASSHSINATIENLSILADFFSTLSSTLLDPLWALFTWQSFEDTKATTIFLITTWPVWMLCFSTQAWDALGLPRIALPLRQYASQVIAFASPLVQRQLVKGLGWARQNWPVAFERGEQVRSHIQRATDIGQAYVVPVLHRLASSFATSSSPSASLRFTLLPPFPLFSLSVRHILFVIGTLTLTWCSPWCALIRHALWRSAVVRQGARRTIALLSGRRAATFFASPPPPVASEKLAATGLLEEDPFTEQPLAELASTQDAKQLGKDFTRHEDVIYQFTILENQRWWVGLDWTAALLPQERPSWSDESNNPVSPPSSFSLPPAKNTLKHAPTSSHPKAYVKRMVRWQWIDAEWSVAGREGGPELRGAQKSRRESTSSTATSGTLFSNSTTSGTTDATAGGDTKRLSGGPAGELPADIQWLDVDAEGWQYGDNSWDRMSRKGGLGRYTRRRRWIRRAVLVEIVQRNYNPTVDELTSNNEDSSMPAMPASIDLPQSPTSPPTSPTSPRQSGDLKQRLARLANASSSSEQ